MTTSQLINSLCRAREGGYLTVPELEYIAKVLRAAESQQQKTKTRETTND